MSTAPERCIGVIAPFSTEEAIVARPLLVAVEAVVAASGAPVSVVALDDGRDAARAIEAVEVLLRRGGCLGVVGPKNSGSALAAAPIAAAQGLPLLLPCATADELTSEAGTVFRMCAPDRATAAAAAALAVELQASRVFVVADDTAYGHGLAVAVRAAAAAAGLTSTDDADGADAAFLAMGEVEQAALIRELRADGFRGDFLSAEGGPGAPIGQLAGEAAEGAWLLYPGAAVADRSVYAAEAADAARVLLAVGDGGAGAIRAGAFEGETGPIRFTAAGEREGVSVSCYRVLGGVVRLVGPARSPASSTSGGS